MRGGAGALCMMGGILFGICGEEISVLEERVLHFCIL